MDYAHLPPFRILTYHLLRYLPALCYHTLNLFWPLLHIYYLYYFIGFMPHCAVVVFIDLIDLVGRTLRIYSFWTPYLSVNCAVVPVVDVVIVPHWILQHSPYIPLLFGILFYTFRQLPSDMLPLLCSPILTSHACWLHWFYTVLWTFVQYILLHYLPVVTLPLDLPDCPIYICPLSLVPIAFIITWYPLQIFSNFVHSHYVDYLPHYHTHCIVVQWIVPWQAWHYIITYITTLPSPLPHIFATLCRLRWLQFHAMLFVTCVSDGLPILRLTRFVILPLLILPVITHPHTIYYTFIPFPVDGPHYPVFVTIALPFILVLPFSLFNIGPCCILPLCIPVLLPFVLTFCWWIPHLCSVRCILVVVTIRDVISPRFHSPRCYLSHYSQHYLVPVPRCYSRCAFGCSDLCRILRVPHWLIHCPVVVTIPVQFTLPLLFTLLLLHCAIVIIIYLIVFIDTLCSWCVYHYMTITCMYCVFVVPDCLVIMLYCYLCLTHPYDCVPLPCSSYVYLLLISQYYGNTPDHSRWIRFVIVVIYRLFYFVIYVLFLAHSHAIWLFLPIVNTYTVITTFRYSDTFYICCSTHCDLISLFLPLLLLLIPHSTFLLFT